MLKHLTGILALTLCFAATAFATSITGGKGNSSYGQSFDSSANLTISGVPIFESLTASTSPNPNISLFTFSFQGNLNNFKFSITGLTTASAAFNLGVLVCDNGGSSIPCTNNGGNLNVSAFGVSYTCANTACNFTVANASKSSNLTLFVTEDANAKPPTITAMVTPEPSSMLLVGSGIVGVITRIRRKRT